MTASIIGAYILLTRERWGDLETVATKIAGRRLEWLGNLARMQDIRMPKTVLFS